MAGPCRRCACASDDDAMKAHEDRRGVDVVANSACFGIAASISTITTPQVIRIRLEGPWHLCSPPDPP